MLIVKLVGIAIVLAILMGAAMVADLVANDGRLFYMAMGRDRLVGACTPPMRDDLVRRGFAPADIEFAPHPSIGFASGSLGGSRTFAGAFTFSDGPNGPRVDGSVMCVVRGSNVTVDVEVDHLPVRAA